MAKREPDLRVFGLVKIGEKGQIVIPAGARAELNLNPGDEVIVVGSPNKGIVGVVREEVFRDMLSQMQRHFEEGMAVGNHFANIGKELDNLKNNSSN